MKQLLLTEQQRADSSGNRTECRTRLHVNMQKSAKIIHKKQRRNIKAENYEVNRKRNTGGKILGGGGQEILTFITNDFLAKMYFQVLNSVVFYSTAFNFGIKAKTKGGTQKKSSLL